MRISCSWCQVRGHDVTPGTHFNVGTNTIAPSHQNFFRPNYLPPPIFIYIMMLSWQNALHRTDTHAYDAAMVLIGSALFLDQFCMLIPFLKSDLGESRLEKKS